MRYPITIFFLLLSSCIFAQAPTTIGGTIADENGRPLKDAMIHYLDDTAYSDKKGNFKLAYANPQHYLFYVYIEKKGFLPKSLYIKLGDDEVEFDTTLVLRSRKAFWYDSKQINDTHLGITLRQAIIKYKLDLSSCDLVQEPTNVFHGVRAELGDSAYIFLMTRPVSADASKFEANNLLDSTIIGIGVADTNGHEKYYGNSFLWNEDIKNPYYLERLFNTEDEQRKKLQSSSR